MGAAYPPQPSDVLLQHCIWLGPGHSPAVEVPLQSEAQLHRDEEPLQAGLEQHFTLAASAGQAPEMELPPAEEQAESVMQTPGAPLPPIQGSLTAARAAVARRRRNFMLFDVSVG